VQTKLHLTTLARFSSVSILLLCLCSFQAFAQKEQLLKKKLFLDDPHDAIESITLPNQTTIFGAWDENSHTSFETASGLWITDGTEAGTKMLKSFLKEPGTGFLENITLSTDFFYFNNKVFLNARNHIDDSINFLYVTDGTEKGTIRLVDKAVAKSYYAIYNEKLYISNGTELLTSDGTKAGTRKVSVAALPAITNLFTINQYLIVDTAKELYVYNDKTGTLSLLSGKTEAAVATRDYVFFVGKDGDLWRTDGTLQGTKAVRNIAEGADVLAPKSLMATSRFAVFKSYADKTKEKTCLWISDGNIAEPMKNSSGGIVSTDTTGFMPLPTKFDEKLYFYLNNLDQNTLASNNYLFVFQNGTASAKYLENIRGVYEAQLFPFSPKINTKEEYFYARPENPGWLEGDYTIKGFNASTDSLITLTRIETEGRTSWIKGGNKIYYNKDMQGYEPGLYVKGACGFDATIEAPYGTHICGDNSLMLSASIITFGTSQAIYTARWEHENDPPKYRFYRASEAGVYTLHVTDGICTISNSINITKSDSLSVVITSISSLCPGQSIGLKAAAKYGMVPFTYQWKNGANNVGTNEMLFNTNLEGNYSVLVKDSQGCEGKSAVYVVKQEPLPNVQITKNASTDIVSGGSITLSVLAAANQTYQWYEDAVAIAGARSNTYTATKAGKYSVTVSANGCSASSEVVIVNLVLANESTEETVLLQAYPNPTDNLIKLSITEPLKKTAQISLINTKGIVVKKWETKQQENTLNLSDLPAGEYLLKAHINNQSVTKKLIKQ
jgi:ELWxxDGT repeat protein